METREQYTPENILRFTEVISSPVIICNSNREVVAYNTKAADYFTFTGEGFPFSYFVQQSEQGKLQQLFSDSSRNRRAVEEIISCKSAGDVFIKGKLAVKCFSQELDETYYLLNFTPLAQRDANTSTLVSVNTGELSDIIKNKKILQVIDDIHSNYPFTFIGRNKIQQEINKLEELFWIKDVNDSYVLVNRRFADALGLKPQQLEGRNEKNFLPIYFMEFYRSLENYIKDTLNSLTIEGIPFRGFSSWNSYQTIEVPLCDNEGNVIAIIGVSQKKQAKTSRSESDHSGSGDLQIIEKLPQTVAVFNRQQEMLSASRAFMKQFTGVARKNAHLSEFFSENTYEQLHLFLESDQTAKQFELELSFKKDESSLFSLELQKVAFGADEWQELIISFEKVLSYDSIEELLKQKGRMFETLIQYNPEPIFIYDAENLRFLEVNDAALQLYGYRREEFLQMDLTDLYSPEDIQSLLDANTAAQKTPKFQGPFKHRKKDGSSILVEIAKTPFVFEQREAHFNIVRNVSEQASKVVDLEIFKTIFEHTTDAVVMTDSTGFIKDANKSAAVFFGIGAEDLRNSSVIEYLADDDRRVVNTSVFYSKSTNTVELSARFLNAGGTETECTVKAIPILGADGVLESFNIIIHPKAEPEVVVKEVVKEVEVIREVEKIKEVPVAVTVTGAAVQPAAARGIDAAQIGTIFHEILTPINVILGFVQELKESIGRPDKEQMEALEFIDQNRENLLDIMNSISEFAQIKTNSDDLEPEEISIAEMIDESMQEEKEYAESLGKEVLAGRISGSLQVYSDKKKLKSFLTQMVKIISRITDENTIYISSQQYDDDVFIVSFRDNFSRISEKTFDAFEGFFLSKSQQSPKNFHLSRYNFASVKELIKILRSEYEVVLRSGKPYEIGFKFPMNLFEERSQPVMDEFEPDTPWKAAANREYHSAAATEHVNPYGVTRETVYDPKPQSVQQPEYVHTPFPPVQPAAKLTGQWDEPVADHGFGADDDFVIPANERFSFQSSAPIAQPGNPVRKDTTAYHSLDFTTQKSPEPEAFFEAPAQKPLGRETVQQPAAPGWEPIATPPVRDAMHHAPVAAPQQQYPVQEPAFTVPAMMKSQETAAFGLSDLRCLYIEDQVDSQILFKVQMKELQEIKFAVSFEEALPLLTSNSFDFIVMDINLQGEYNGLDALKMIHQMPQFQNLPIIAVTAYVLPGDKEKFILAGFNDFISKPIFREKMIDALEKIFKKKINA